ncbi:MAG TPA: GNAT family N-acetyltransferase [Alphaproteobacteria bacterium]|jgi:RimJ/RimL family protein N-acetyltransferase
MKLPIQTARLVLRDMTGVDWREVHAYNRDPEFYRFLPIDSPDEEATRGFVRLCLARARARPRRHYDPILCERTTGRVVGTLRLSLRERGVADFGYAIRPEAWNRGYATEAVAALLGAARRPLGLVQVWATVDPENAASCRVLEKLGFSCCGGEAGASIKAGRPPSLVYKRSLAPAEFVSERAL